jgi:hypothetical protein
MKRLIDNEFQFCERWGGNGGVQTSSYDRAYDPSTIYDWTRRSFDIKTFNGQILMTQSDERHNSYE